MSKGEHLNTLDQKLSLSENDGMFKWLVKSHEMFYGYGSSLSLLPALLFHIQHCVFQIQEPVSMQTYLSQGTLHGSQEVRIS